MSPFSPRPPRLFEVGRNCCALARAQRVAFLVDGEEYFRAFAAAAERACHSLIVLAWDFNSHACLRYGGTAGRGPPAGLGDFLNWLARRRSGLQIYVLDWDYPMVFGTDREFPPLYGLGWKPHRHVHVCYDNTHPLGGSHHQKIVVIDDAMAFVGGFDLTARRWDTCAHRADEPGRVCGAAPYPPFHDLMMAVDGEAAAALAAIARARWQAASEQLPPPLKKGGDPWPPTLAPAVREVEVAIARTLPATAGQGEVREVERLYLDMIAAARRSLYIENQYFTAHRIGEALAARLAEPDGPEVVLVSRLLSHGWLEEYTMHVLRARLLRRLYAADGQGRFRAYYADINGLGDGTCIDIHSKLLIVDDEILRIGSANLCNRSMGMDSECDAAIAAAGDGAVRAAIRDFRHRLLGEHLDVPPARVAAECERRGSLTAAIEALRGRPRTLRPLQSPPDWPEAVLDLAGVADPERPVSLDEMVAEFSPEIAEPGKFSPPARLAALALAILALAALWRYTPLAQFLSAERVSAWAQQFAHRPWAPLLVLLAYTPASLVLFPRALITFGAVIAFGPWLGFAYALAGVLLAAFLTYVAGRCLPRQTVRDLSGEQLNHIMEALRRRGLLAMTALRLVPLAPFAVEGLVAGAIHVKLWHFMLGTLFGILPGTLAATLFGGQIEAGLRDHGKIDYGLIAAVAALLVILSLAVRKWLTAQRRHSQENAGPPQVFPTPPGNGAAVSRGRSRRHGSDHAR